LSGLLSSSLTRVVANTAARLAVGRVPHLKIPQIVILAIKIELVLVRTLHRTAKFAVANGCEQQNIKTNDSTVSTTLIVQRAPLFSYHLSGLRPPF
jgi:hypothetical protein